MAKISWEESILLEHDVAQIISEQEDYGVYFNIGKAHYFVTDLEEKKEELYSKIRKYLTYDIICKENNSQETKEYKVDNFGTYTLYKGEKQFVKKIRNKDQSYTSSVVKWYPDGLDIVSGPFSRISIEEPQISKRQLIIKQLLLYGWKPEIFTEKGSPKLTVEGEPVDTLLDVGPFGQDLALWYIYNHRQSQIQGFFNHVREDGRISAQCNPCGTNTFRAKHRVVANIPRPTSVYGKEMRSLFCVAKDRVFVGADVAGLELRMLAHHMKDPEFIDQILHGDIHTFNQHKAGLPTRDDAKTFIYAFLYGAGDAKIGRIVNGTAKDGKRLKEEFLDGLPRLKVLISKVQRFAETRGWIPSIDDRKIYIRSYEGKILVHTALNALLQANGSIVTKRAMVIADKEIKRRGLDCHQIIFYHDEMAYDCNPDCKEEVSDILLESMKQAGEFYNLDIPITGDVKFGDNWGIH